MAQTIQLKRSNTSGNQPTTSNLELGEIAINTKDGKLFVRKHVDGSDAADGILAYGPQGVFVHETQVYQVKVISKSAVHPYHGTGSSNGYSIGGLESPYLVLMPGNTYKFDQANSTNSGHPFRFYLEAAKTTAYTTGVTTNGTPGSSGAYTQIVVSATTPQILFYQCSAHGFMGSAAYTLNDAIAANAVTSTQIAANAVGTSELAQNSVTAVQIPDSSITATQMGANSVDSSELVDGSIDTSHIGTSQVTTAKIADSNITTAKIADSNVTVAKMAANSVDSDQYVDGSIDTVHIADSQITSAKIADGTIVTGDIAANTIATANIADNAIDSTKIASNSILTRHIDDNQITIDQLAVTDGSNGQVLKTDGSGTLSFGTVSSGSGSTEDVFKTISVSGQSNVVADSDTDTLTLAAGSGMSITTAAGSDTITFTSTATGLSANAVTATHIATGAVGASELAATSVNAGSYTNTDLTVDADGRITSASNGSSSGSIGANAVTAAKIATGAVGSSELASTGVTASTYGSATASPQFTVDADGRITSASNVTIQGAGGSSGGIGLNQVMNTNNGTGNGSTTAFTSSGTIHSEDLVWVFVDGVYQQKNTYSTSGTTVTLSQAPPTGASVEILNLTNITTGGAFNFNEFSGNGSATGFTLSKAPDSETDLLVFIDGIYQNRDAFTVSGTTLTFDTAPSASTKVIAYSIGGIVTGKAQAVNSFNGNNSTTAFTLSLDPADEKNTMVYVSGIYQPKSTYAVSGTTLTFSEAPPTGTGNIEVVISQITTTTDVGDASVGTVQLKDANVTLAKLAAASVNSSKIVDASIVGADIAANTITVTNLADGAVETDKIANNAITSTQIARNSILASELAQNALNTAELARVIEDSANFTTTGVGTFGTITSGAITASTGTAIGQATFSSNIIQSNNTGNAGARIRLAVSSEANPVYSFENDTNTGMFTSGADTLNFTTGGTQRMRIASDGKVGIGMTANSGCLLNVNSHVRAENSAFLAGRENASLPAFAFHDDTDTGMFNVASNILAFSTAGAERARVLANGDIVLGNTVVNPASGFNSQRGFGYDNDTGIVEIATTANAQVLVLGKNHGTDGSLLDFRKQSTVVGSIGVVGGNNLYINGDTVGLGIGDDNLYPTNATGASTNGALDIGDSSAKFRNLHLSGTISSGAITSTGGVSVGGATPFLMVQDSDTSNSGVIEQAGTDLFYGNSSSSGTHIFRNNSSNGGRPSVNGTELMRIASTGRVGIGIAAPESHLHVKAADNVTAVLKIEGGKPTVTGVGEINAQLDFGSNDASVNNTGNIGGRIASVTSYSNGSSVDMTFSTFKQDADPKLSEKMRVTDTGRVGIGTSSPQELVHLKTGASTALRVSGGNNDNKKVEIGYDNTNGPYLKGGSSGETGIQFYVDNTTLAGKFASNADFYTNDGTIHSLSDSRVKTDINDLIDGIDVVKQLQPKTFKYNKKSEFYSEKTKDEVKYGFVADEVQEVAPQYMQVGKGKIDGVEVDDLKTLSTTKMIPMLVKAIQEQQTTIENLRARLDNAGL